MTVVYMKLKVAFKPIIDCKKISGSQEVENELQMQKYLVISMISCCGDINSDTTVGHI